MGYISINDKHDYDDDYDDVVMLMIETVISPMIFSL